ncbi:MAG: molybdopterin-dependent oxidoreductase, partial [Pseudomonadota bacterium]
MDGTPTSSHWGAGLVDVEDGRVKAVRAHPADRHPSRINENIAGSLNGASRVLKPAIRKGWLEGGGRRGNDQFVEVSWDVALDHIASELTRVRRDHGAEGIYAGSYGWASAGRFHHAQSQLKRFLNEGGGFVRSEGNYSYNAGLTLFPHIVSDFRYQVANATRWRSVAEHGDLAVLFGGAAFRNAQVSGGGVARHRLEDDLTACRDAGIEFVNFSPLRSDAAEALGAEWIAPRPGSDTAIMLALSHTLLAEDLHNRAFLDRYCVGFERVAAYLNGADGQPKDADWAAQLSEVPAETIRALARRMAAKRT